MHFLYVSMYLYVFVCIFKDTYTIHTWYIQKKQCISLIQQCKIHTDKTVQRRNCICIYRYVSVCNVSISYMRMYLYVFVCISQMCTRHLTTFHSFIPSNLEQCTQQGLGRACTAAWCRSRRCLATKLGPPGDSSTSRRRSQSGHTDTANSISDTNKHEIYAIHLKY